jgi:hypothetical protein
MSAIQAAEQLLAKMSRARKRNWCRWPRAIWARLFPASRVVRVCAAARLASCARASWYGCSSRHGGSALPNQICSERTQLCAPKIWQMPGLTSARTRTRFHGRSQPTKPSDGAALLQRELPTAGRAPIARTRSRCAHDSGNRPGRAGAARAEVLEFARREGRVVLTLNRLHFLRLHREHASHAGIVVCTFDQHFSAQAERIHGLIANEGSLSGKLIRLNRA